MRTIILSAILFSSPAFSNDKDNGVPPPQHHLTSYSFTQSEAKEELQLYPGYLNFEFQQSKKYKGYYGVELHTTVSVSSHELKRYFRDLRKVKFIKNLNKVESSLVFDTYNRLYDEIIQSAKSNANKKIYATLESNSKVTLVVYREDVGTEVTGCRIETIRNSTLLIKKNSENVAFTGPEVKHVKNVNSIKQCYAQIEYFSNKSGLE